MGINGWFTAIAINDSTIGGAQTEIDPAAYQRKCKIAPDAADFYCPELERAVERSRRWDPIFRSGMSRHL
jgi:hypothetical protein